jgi:hypothetical protein
LSRIIKRLKVIPFALTKESLTPPAWITKLQALGHLVRATNVETGSIYIYAYLSNFPDVMFYSGAI